jgi:DNA repair exonuclease SbcCD ATPase subunit
MTAQCWTPIAVELRGYGGVGAEPLSVPLDRPLIVLTGPNGSGKSTIVSAIEWALFGTLTLGRDFEVADLKGAGKGPHLVYLNRGCDVAEVVVQFERDGSRLVWRRIRNRATPHREKDVVECTVDGRAVEARPAAVFGVTSELYCRALAPRQANLVSLLSLESKERNAALDLLFGIEELNLLAEGLSKAKADHPRSLKALAARLAEAEAGLSDEIARRFDQRAAARDDAIAAGIEKAQLSLEGGRALAASLAHELGLPAPAEGAGVSELRTLHAQLVKAADAAWSRPEPQVRWERLTALQDTLKRGAPAWWRQAVAARENAQQDLKTLRTRLGTETDLEARVRDATKMAERAAQELSAANERAAILTGARGWLQHQHGSGRELACPVCEQPVIATELAGLVEATLNELRESDGTTASLAAKEAEARAALKAASTDKAQLDRAIEELSDREQDVASQRSKLLEAVRQADEVWRGAQSRDVEHGTIDQLQQLRDGATDADEPLLDRLLGDLASACAEALARTNDDLRQAGSLAGQRRDRVIALGRLLDFLHAAERLDTLDVDVSEVELAEARDRLASAHRAGDILSKVTAAAGEIAQAEATVRTAAVAAKLNTWFANVSVHDRLKGAGIEVQTNRAGGRLRNSYQLRATDTQAAWQAAPGPMLSGAYQMLLAVAALCALADTSARRLGLLVLDEPTLSLDPELTERLGSTLAASVPPVRTVVATADPAFTRAIEERGGERVRVIRLAPWTGAAGTRVADG